VHKIKIYLRHATDTVRNMAIRAILLKFVFIIIRQTRTRTREEVMFIFLAESVSAYDKVSAFSAAMRQWNLKAISGYDAMVRQKK